MPMMPSFDSHDENNQQQWSRDAEKSAIDARFDGSNVAGQYDETQTPIDHAVEKRVVRKLDLHLVPLVFALFLLSFLDRSNIGNAREAGMEDDLHFDMNGQGPHTYDWLLTIFYISYIVFEFGILGWKLVPPHIWGACVTFAWGMFSTLQAATFGWSGMMALRFFLGASEAFYGPGIVYLLSFFYLRHEVGFRQGLFLSAAPLATCFAGALAYGITQEKDPNIAPWRLLFIVEGLPTVLMAPVVWFFLPDGPHKVRSLTPEEKKVASARSVRQAGKADRIGRIVWKDVGLTLLDLKAWLTALMYFSCNVAYGSLPVFLPTFLRVSLKFDQLSAQGLTAPPYFFSFLITFTTPWIADKFQQRGLMICFLSIIGGVGYIMLATVSNVWVRYAGVFLAAGGVFPSISNILPWVTNNQGTDTRRGIGVVMLNVVGQCGPLLGTRMYPTTDGPNFTKGHAVCAAFMFFNALLAIILRTLLWWENKRLDKKYGTVEEQRARLELAGEKEIATENYGPTYRYIM